MFELFVALITGLVDEWAADALYAAFCAVVKRENEVLVMLKRIVSEPLLSALDFLEDAANEVSDPQRRLADVEQARLNFVKASNLDFPLPAARAAFYVGVCHHLRQRTAHELRWYERSYSMMSALEDSTREEGIREMAINPLNLFRVPVKGLVEIFTDAPRHRANLLDELSKYKKAIRDLIEARSVVKRT
jgi:hypothetical protein